MLRAVLILRRGALAAAGGAAGVGAATCSAKTRDETAYMHTMFRSELRRGREEMEQPQCISGGKPCRGEADDEEFATGGTRKVHKANLTGALKSVAVMKRFIKETPYTQEFWDQDLDLVKDAQGFAKRWNNLGRSSKVVEFLTPDVWQVEDTGETVLVEEFLEGEFLKWNSNSGWTAPAEHGGEMLQAFSHWTFHESSGRKLVCDIQGVRATDSYKLTDPVVLSDPSGGQPDLDGQYAPMGLTDLGLDGMHAFFYNHDCNRFCSKKWMTIDNPKMPKWFKPTTHTTFIDSATQRNRCTVLTQDGMAA